MKDPTYCEDCSAVHMFETQTATYIQLALTNDKKDFDRLLDNTTEVSHILKLCKMHNSELHDEGVRVRQQSKERLP